MAHIDAAILALQLAPLFLLAIALIGGIQSKRKSGDALMFGLVIVSIIACALISGRFAYFATKQTTTDIPEKVEA